VGVAKRQASALKIGQCPAKAKLHAKAQIEASKQQLRCLACPWIEELVSLAPHVINKKYDDGMLDDGIEQFQI
jgi:hypothetical protein